MFGWLVWAFAGMSAFANYSHSTNSTAVDAVWFFPAMSIAGPFLLEIIVRRVRRWVQEGTGQRDRHADRVRLAGDAVLELWDGNAAATGDRSAARRELTIAAGTMTNWYEHFAASLTGRDPVPEPLAPDEVANGRLIDAVERDLVGSDGYATATGIRVIWTGDNLDAVRRLQADLARPAQTATSVAA